jgi:hypothetical protein
MEKQGFAEKYALYFFHFINGLWKEIPLVLITPNS